jgi:hypothetical protein
MPDKPATDTPPLPSVAGNASPSTEQSSGNQGGNTDATSGGTNSRTTLNTEQRGGGPRQSLNIIQKGG